MNKLCRIFSPAANLQETPGQQQHIGTRDSQLLHGEFFRVDRCAGDWAHGHGLLDGYSGWVHDSDLAIATDPPSHAVTVPSTNAYAAPDAKTRPVKDFSLSFMSRVTVEPAARRNGFIMLRDHSVWVPESHLIAIADLAANPADIIDTAMMFSGYPYILGGRGSRGIDCSGLVQIAVQRNGIFCPRDSDQQENIVGTEGDAAQLQRGDAVYFPGHVALMIDGKNAINATMRHMKVIAEPLDSLIQGYGPPRAVRRLMP